MRIRLLAPLAEDGCGANEEGGATARRCLALERWDGVGWITRGEMELCSDRIGSVLTGLGRVAWDGEESGLMGQACLGWDASRLGGIDAWWGMTGWEAGWDTAG